jgi:YHS domain-containing protein
MDRRVFVLTFGMAAAITVGSVAAGQHEGHQAGAATAPSAAQVTDCRQAQPVITGLLNAALKRLEDARLTNSAAAMRDAADDVQAALVDMRTQLAPCGEMQLASAAQVAPTTPTAQTSPAGAPGMPAPRAGAPASAPAAADAHAGHAAPAAQQTPAARAPAAVPAGPPVTQQRPAAPAAADSHAGQVMPAAPGSRRPSASTARPPAAKPASPAPAASDAHAGRATPPAASPSATTGAAASATAPAPPTSIADLKCTNTVDQRTAPRMLYQGRMYYFCTEASRAEFAKDPAKVVTAAPQAAPAHAH